MVQNLPSKDHNYSAGLEISYFMEPEGSLHCPQKPVIGTYPNSIEPSSHLQNLFL